MHKKDFTAVSGGRPLVNPAADDGIVPLSETGATLDLLFEFLYPRRQPDWEAFDFQVIYDLAHAASKYEVYSAIAVFKIILRLGPFKHLGGDICGSSIYHILLSELMFVPIPWNSWFKQSKTTISLL